MQEFYVFMYNNEPWFSHSPQFFTPHDSSKFLSFTFNYFPWRLLRFDFISLLDAVINYFTSTIVPHNDKNFETENIPISLI